MTILYSCARVSFLLNLHAETCNFIFKKDMLEQMFPCVFWEISKNTFFTEHLWITASDHNIFSIISIILDLETWNLLR